MKRKEFKLLLSKLQEFQQKCDKLSNVGLDVYENECAIAPYAEFFFEEVLKQNWNRFGVDWITWFIYENDFGNKKLGAWDGSTLICQTVDELYNYCKQHRKH